MKRQLPVPRLVLAAACALVLLRCEAEVVCVECRGDGGLDAGVRDGGFDGGPVSDAGALVDGGELDGGVDAGSAEDSGLRDAGQGDAGMSDAGKSDAGAPDSGVVDAGKSDAGAVDAGSLDAGKPDAGGVDAGPGPDAGPSGEAMPLGDLPHFHQIFTDDFLNDVPVGSFPTAVSSKWKAYPSPWQDTSKNGVYTPLKVLSQQGGLLNMYLHTENGVHMVSAPVPVLPGVTSPGGGQLYGRYAARFRADSLHGYKTAWLLWPDSETWPRDGEIDFPEGNLDGTIAAFMHRQNGSSGSDQDAYSTTKTYGTWHTAVLEWTPTYVMFMLDGVVLGTSTARIPNTPMHYVLQTETALDGTVPADAVAGNVQVDWVAVWSYVP